MPIYEYQCQKCGNELEAIHSASAEPLTVCESCGGALQKKMSLSGFALKGSGWYTTDYKGGAKKSDPSSSSSGGSTS